MLQTEDEASQKMGHVKYWEDKIDSRYPGLSVDIQEHASTLKPTTLACHYEDYADDFGLVAALKPYKAHYLKMVGHELDVVCCT